MRTALGWENITSCILLLWRACLIKLSYWQDKHPKLQSTNNLSAGYVWMVSGSTTGRDKKGCFSPFWQRQHLMKGNSLNCRSRQVSVGLCLIPVPFIQAYRGLLNMFLLPANVIRLIVQLVAVCLRAEERLTHDSQHRRLVLHKIIILLKK